MSAVAFPLVLLLAAAPQTVELHAERVVHDGARELTTAEGDADLYAANAALHADRITWDANTRAATAVGHVTVRLTGRGLLAVLADLVTVRMDGEEVSEVFIHDGLVLRKVGTTASELLAARTTEQVRATGSTSMTMTATHLVREESGTWRSESLVFTPCDCDLDRPVWHIGAARTSVDFEAERADLLSPVVYVKDVPVLWFPWLSLPLSDRQSGLLVPRPNFTTLNGFSFEQPVFVTLGRSADLTFTPGYFFGSNGTYGIAGPRLLTEFRYAPSNETTGRATVGLLYDTRDQRDVVTPSLARPGTPRGLRADATWQHTQDLGGGFHDRVDAAFLSDGYLQRDLVTDVLAREAGYVRSSAALFHRGDDHYLGADVVFRQDVSWGYPAFGGPTFLTNQALPGRGTQPWYGPNSLQRLPGIVFAVPERTLIGPLSAELRADYARLAPVWGGTGDEGPSANEGRAVAMVNGVETPIGAECLQQRLYNPAPNLALCPVGMAPLTGKEFQGDRVYQSGEREARDRFGLMPTVQVRGSLFDVVVGSATAAWRQDVWLGELSGRTAQRGYALLGARVDSELARSFGDFRHVIAPSLELRAVPVAVGSAPAAYDEVDQAIPQVAPQAQVSAVLRQRLLVRSGGAAREVLRLDLGQGLDLLAPGQPRLSESWGRLSASWWLWRASASLRVDPVLGRVTRVSASAALDDGRGRGLFAAYDRLIDEGTDRSRQPIDLLFAGPPVNPTQGRPQIFTTGARWRLAGLGLRYDAMFLQRQFAPDPMTPPTRALALTQHTLGVSWGPACDCWRLEVFATQRIKDDQLYPSAQYRFPDLGAQLTISGFGSLGVQRP